MSCSKFINLRSMVLCIEAFNLLSALTLIGIWSSDDHHSTHLSNKVNELDASSCFHRLLRAQTITRMMLKNFLFQVATLFLFVSAVCAITLSDARRPLVLKPRGRLSYLTGEGGIHLATLVPGAI